MKIYGVAILAACYLTGQIIGNYLGHATGIGGNVGGVGFGMLLLILINTKYPHRIDEQTNAGIVFWSGMYIPIVVAMSATQNVKAAFSGGLVAVVAGILATGFLYFLIPVLSKLSQRHGDH